MNAIDKWNFASELIQRHGVNTRNTKIKHLLLEAIEEAIQEGLAPKIISAMYIDIAEYYRNFRPFTEYTVKINKQYQAFAWQYAVKAEEQNTNNEDANFIKAQLLRASGEEQGFQHEMLKFYDKTNESEKAIKLFA